MAPKKISTPLQVIGEMPELTEEARTYMESNQINLDAACLYSFVFMKYPPLHLDQVVEFVKNSAMVVEGSGGSSVRVAGKNVDFTTEALAQRLRLHGGGPILAQVKPLPKKKLMEVLGEDVVEAKKYQLSQLTEDWIHWVTFLNQRLLLSTDVITDLGLSAAVQAWEGRSFNWAEILHGQIRRELSRKKSHNPMRLHCAAYLSLLCQFDFVEPENVPLPPSTEQEKKRIHQPPSTSRGKKNKKLRAEAPEVQEVVKERQPRPYVEAVAMALSIPSKFTPMADSNNIEEMRKRLEFQHVTEFRLLQDYKASVERETTLRKKIKEVETSLDTAKKNLKAKEEELTKSQAEVVKLTAENKELIQCLSDQGKKSRLDQETILQLNRSMAEQQSNRQAEEEQKQGAKEARIRLLETELDRAREAAKRHKGQMDIMLTMQTPRIQPSVSTIEQESLKAENNQLTRQVDKLRLALWKHEKQSPPSSSLFRAYELERSVFLEVAELKLESQIDEGTFRELWNRASAYPHQQNLLCEMIARGDLELTDPKVLLQPVGHLGARAVAYYMELETQLSLKRRMDQVKPPDKKIRMQDHIAGLQEVAEDCTEEEREEFRGTLEGLRDRIRDQEDVKDKLAKTLERNTLADRGELNTGHYIYSLYCIHGQLQTMLQALERGQIHMIRPQLQVELTLPPPTFNPPRWISLHCVITGSAAKCKYLGKYESLFDNPTEEPVLSWKAMSWVLEDYGLSVVEERAWDLVYRELAKTRTFVNWTEQPPPAVSTNVHFCGVNPRRYKWPPEATIDSLEYNWALIPGRFDNASMCAESYQEFFRLHKTHTDPVCFRAAIFCNFLAKMCREYGVIINVNKYEECRPEFLLSLKLQYRGTRWNRMVEIMAITHFLHGVHGCFINEFKGTRKIAYDNWLRAQRTKDTRMMDDGDVRRAIDKTEAEEHRRALLHRDRHRNRLAW